MARFHVVWVSLALVASACGGDGSSQLIIDVRTDLRSGTDFVDFRATVFRGEETNAERDVTVPAPASRDLSTGFRVAEIGGLASGEKRVEIAALDSEGVVVTARVVRVDASGTTAISASLTRTCAGVSCPSPSDAPDQTECLGGRCVTPACARGDGDACDVPTLPLGEFLRQTSSATCEMVRTCSGPIADLVFRGVTCEALTAMNIEDHLGPRIEQSFIEGRIVYHPEHAYGCLNALRTDCRGISLLKHQLECIEALEGTVEIGSECYSDFDCSGVGSFCDLADRCPGVCTARQSTGGSCSSTSECEIGAKCSEGVCRLLVTNGEVCEPESELCRFDAVCSEDASGVARCNPIAEVFSAGSGEPCGAGGIFCAEGLSCDLTARACISRLTSGAACVDAVPDACPVDEYCDPSSRRCESLPVNGASCVRVDESLRCGSGYRCDSTATCVETRRVGQTCTDSFQCTTSICTSGECRHLCTG